MQSNRASTGGDRSGISFAREKRGFLLGTLAFLLNYGVVYLFLALDGATWGGRIGVQSEGISDLAGLTLYNAQFVRAELGATLAVSGGYNFVTSSPAGTGITGTVPAVAYHAVPVLVLCSCGFLLDRWTNESFSWRSVPLIGMSIAPGYTLPCALGLVAFHVHATAGVEPVWLWPDPLPAILLAGVCYPAVFGGVGALVGRRLLSH